MNESTQKTPGQIAFEGMYPNGAWIAVQNKTKWENAAQAVISAHKPRITAEDVEAAIYSAFQTGFGYQSGWEKMAEFLNARFQPQDESPIAAHDVVEQPVASSPAVDPAEG